MIILAATPIGNLGDASPRRVAALEAATVVASEDTRTTQRLLAALGVTNRPRLLAMHDHNEKERAASIVELATEGDVLVLSRQFDLRELVEDELLLMLPIVPKHEQCPAPLPLAAPGLAAEDVAPAHPFAALAALKRGGGP